MKVKSSKEGNINKKSFSKFGLYIFQGYLMCPNIVDPSNRRFGSVTRHKKSKFEPPTTTGLGLVSAVCDEGVSIVGPGEKELKIT